MSSTVVYKQRFAKRADSRTPGLNVRHLHYIATRPGAVYNLGCGFGLWGRLPGDPCVQLQNNLQKAERQIYEASKDLHTIYRGLVSVDDKTGMQYDLYNRARWEQLINAQIATIAKEMDIKQEYFYWCASMHCTKGHPHVHIVFWDGSTQPRPEYIPEKLFDAKTEHIRAAFAGEIHREEIRENQHLQRDEIKLLRASIQAMCLDANPEKILNFPKLYQSAWLDGAVSDMADLIRQLPVKGSLRYAYLPTDYKALVDRFISNCLERPDFAKELNKYRCATEKISNLYANGDQTTVQNMEKAMDKLYKELGNQVMTAIREIRQQISLDSPTGGTEAQLLIQEAVHTIVPTLDSYLELCWTLPRDRIPYNQMPQIEGYSSTLEQVVQDVQKDARIRIRLQNYALKMAGVDPEAATTDRSENLHRVGSISLDAKQWAAYQHVYAEAQRELRMRIADRARYDKGWDDEALHTGTAVVVLDSFRLLSRLTGQKQAQVSLSKIRQLLSKDKSKEAKKDELAKHEFESEWDVL